MKLHYNNGRVSEKGFIYVASRTRLYYELAILSCESLKSFFPNSHVTLFTHEKFVDDRCKIFDSVIVDIPIHYRAKMWCMARTPYEKTVYIDSDSLICHKDISKIFNFLDECDLFCGSNLLYTVSDVKWTYIDKERKHVPKYHGSMWGYHKTELNVDFMQTWFDEYVKQVSTPWKYGDKHYHAWQKFDMFTLWRITSGFFEEFERFDKLNIKILSRRWNTTIQDLSEDLDGPRVIMQVHKTAWEGMVNVWKNIEKGLNDENHQIEKRSIRDDVIIYN